MHSGHSLPVMAQVPVPFEVDGNPVTSVIRELAAAYEARGGKSIVVVPDNPFVDVPHAEVHRIDFSQQCPREEWTRRDTLADTARGRFGLHRPLARARYTPVADALTTHAADVVFVHEGLYAMPGAALIASVLPGTPVFLYVHGQISRTIGHRELQRLVRPLAGVICVSEFVAQQLRQRLGASPVPVHAVLNGCDLERFRPDTERDPDQDHEELTVLFVGQVVPRKGADHLVRAAARLFEAGHRFHLRIVGSSVHAPTEGLSEYERELRALAAPLGERMHFVPFTHRGEMAAMYQQADIFCAPSVFDDPCPLVVLEAMASGLPVVASPQGGIPEQLGGAGVLVDPADEQALADVLAALISDHQRRADLSLASRARAEQLSWERQLDQLQACISDTT